MGAQARAELCNRTQSNVLDLQRLLEDMNISLEELGEYVEKVDDRALINEQIPSFPAPSKTDLNFLKPGSQEVLHRKSHIEQYLPPMYPELEKVSQHLELTFMHSNRQEIFPLQREDKDWDIIENTKGDLFDEDSNSLEEGEIDETTDMITNANDLSNGIIAKKDLPSKDSLNWKRSGKNSEDEEDTDPRPRWQCAKCRLYEIPGKPMIGCDSCDDWFHFLCVNLQHEPGDQDWYCPQCRARKSGSFLSTSNMPHGQQSSKRSLNLAGGRRGRPPKASK